MFLREILSTRISLCEIISTKCLRFTFPCENTFHKIFLYGEYPLQNPFAKTAPLSGPFPLCADLKGKL